MDLSEYVAALRGEMTTITRFAGEDVARAAEMLTDAMESSVRLTLLEALSAAAAEITTRLDDAVARLEVISQNGKPGAPDSREEVERIRVQLDDTFKKFTEVEQKLWEQLNIK